MFGNKELWVCREINIYCINFFVVAQLLYTIKTKFSVTNCNLLQSKKYVASD